MKNLSIANELVSVAKNITNRGMYSPTVIIKSTPTFVGNKLENPYLMCHKEGRSIIVDGCRIEKVILLQNACIGMNYFSTYNARLERVGSNDTYEGAQMKGAKPFVFPFVFQSLKDEEVFYFNFGCKDVTWRMKVVYLLDGEVVTDAEIRTQIQRWVKPSQQNFVNTIRPKVENIVLMEQSGQSYTKEGANIDFYKSLFIEK